MPLFAAQSSEARPPLRGAPGGPGGRAAPGAPQPTPRPAAADDIPASPPAEVLDAMGAAADAYDRLKTAGRRLHFETDPSTGRVTVQVLDGDGRVITTLPPSRVLDLADGGTLD